MFGTNKARAIMRRTFLENSPYEALGNNTFRVKNFDAISHEDFADIYATGRPRGYWGISDAQAKSDPPPKRFKRGHFLSEAWVLNRLLGKRRRARYQWYRTPSKGATVLMDNEEALRRTGAAGRPIDAYDFVKKIAGSVDEIKHGTRTLRQLNANELHGQTRIVGYDVPALEFPKNDTAEGISLYPKISEAMGQHSNPNIQLRGILGSARTYLSDRSTLYKDLEGTYLETFERFAPDNWDHEGGSTAGVGLVNFLRREPGRQVQIRFEGEGLRREFFFDQNSGNFIEITNDDIIPEHLRNFVRNARWQSFKRRNEKSNIQMIDKL